MRDRLGLAFFDLCIAIGPGVAVGYWQGPYAGSAAGVIAYLLAAIATEVYLAARRIEDAIVDAHASGGFRQENNRSVDEV